MSPCQSRWLGAKLVRSVAHVEGWPGSLRCFVQPPRHRGDSSTTNVPVASSCSDEGLTQVATACGWDARRDQCRVGHGGGGAFARAAGDGNGLAITELIQRACDFGGDRGAGRPSGLEIGVVPRLGNGGVGDDQVRLGQNLLARGPQVESALAAPKVSRSLVTAACRAASSAKSVTSTCRPSASKLSAAANPPPKRPSPMTTASTAIRPSA